MSKTTIDRYRNTRPVTSHQGVDIDTGALWHRQTGKDLLVLVDEDEYITADFNDHIFILLN